MTPRPAPQDSLHHGHRVQPSAKIRDILPRLRIGSPDTVDQKAVFVASGFKPQVQRPTPIAQSPQRTDVSVPIVKIPSDKHEGCTRRQILECYQAKRGGRFQTTRSGLCRLREPRASPSSLPARKSLCTVSQGVATPAPDTLRLAACFVRDHLHLCMDGTPRPISLDIRPLSLIQWLQKRN